MSPWIVRGLLAFLALEVGICVAFLGDSWKPLQFQERALFQTALSTVRHGEKFVLDEGERSKRLLHVRPLQHGLPKPFLHVPLSEDSRPILESLPPSASRWHLLLTNAHALGCEVAAIEHPLTWEGDDLFHLARLRALDRSLALFDIAVLTVDLQRLPRSEPIPDYLKRSAIPISNVRGETGPLVRVNHVRHAPSAGDAPHLRFAFRTQESVEAVDPLFVRWNDYLIPSFPLAITMAQHDIAPDQVSIDLGQSIRVGDGPIIPIDGSGQLDSDRITLLEHPKRIVIPAHRAFLESEFPGIQDEVGDTDIRCALFTNDLRDNPAPWNDPQVPGKLAKLVSSFEALPQPGSGVAHRRLPLGFEVALLCVLAVTAAFLIGLRNNARAIAFLALGLIALALLAALLIFAHRWTPIAPVIATALAGWLLSLRMTRYLPPQPAASASTAEPQAS